METVTLTGVVDPVAALDLRVRLHELTGGLRPSVTVDLSQAQHVHLAVMATLVSAARRAARHGGSLHVVPPDRADVRREFDRTVGFTAPGTAVVLGA